MLKCWILVVSLFSLTLGQGVNFEKEGSQKNSFESALVDYQQFDGNQIKTWTSNRGEWVSCEANREAGLEWPKNSGKYAVYQSGIWLVCGKVKEPDDESFKDEIRTAAVRYYSSEFQPGQIVYWDTLGNFEVASNQYPQENCIWKAQNPEDPKYRYYKINRGETSSPDYLNWPIEQGAPVDKNSNPLIMGDQTMWCVYNDAEQKNHDQRFASLPLGIEIQTTLFGFAQNDINHQLENVLFVKSLMINKSDNHYDEMYVGIWADPDLGKATDDLAGVDTSLALAYCFNGHSPDEIYGATPPSVGFSFLQKPVVKNSKNTLPWSKDLPSEEDQTELSSFIRFTVGPPCYDPDTKEQVYNLMTGLSTQGEPIINPKTEKPTRFMISGDPITREGWVDRDLGLPGDRRFLLSTGPFAMAPLDSQEIVTAIMIVKGETLMDGIRALKLYQEYIKIVFDSNFDPGSFNSLFDPSLPQNYELKQNYPNPFNPATTISYFLPFGGLVELNIYNLQGQKIQELVNQWQSAGHYSLTWDGTNFSSGIYFFQIKTSDFTQTRKMILIK
jgi:hypothetical protein